MKKVSKKALYIEKCINIVVLSYSIICYLP